MSGIFQAKQKVPKTAPEVSSLRITTSTYGRPIPIGWGQFKMAGWVLWYGDFVAEAQKESISGGKGGGSGSFVSSYLYKTAIIIGLCEGPINDALRLWKGKDQVTSSSTSNKTYSKKESHRIPANGVVTLDAPGTVLSVTTVFGFGVYFDDVAPSYSYTRSGNVLTFTDGFGDTVSITYTYTKTAAANSPLGNANLTLFKGTYPQSAWSYLTSNHPTEAINYPGIAYVASPSYELGGSTSLPNTSIEIDSGMGYSQAIRDVSPKDFLADFLTNPYYGANFATQGLGDWTDYHTYCVASGLFLSPDYTEQESAAEIVARTLAITNSDCVMSDGVLEIVPYADQAVTGNGKTWTPDLVAAYDLTIEDFLPLGNGGPVRLKRKNPKERYNQLKIRYRNRAQEYNDDVFEAKDEAEIGKNGLRPAPYDSDWHEIKDSNVAVTAGNLLVQRLVNVCNTYVFRLPFRFALLKPMSLVTLTYAPLLLEQQLVRINVIREINAKGDLEVEAEEVPVGTASSILYPNQVPLGATINYNVPPGSVSAPLIFEAPAHQTTTGLEVLAAVRGTNPNWGGFTAWVSMDGTNYRKAGRVEGGSRYGQLTGPISGGSLPVSILGGQLLSGSTADADALATLCYIGGAAKEFLAYATATLTGTLTYTLSGLVRGAYGSTVAAHSTNDPFVRIDDALARSGPLDLSYIGKTIYFKFTSFNIYGGAEQSLADATEYTYTVTGAGAQLLPGIGGKALRLKATAFTFRVPSSGPTEPSSITFTAERLGLLTGTVTFSIQSGTGTLTGTGDTRALAASSMTSEILVVRASLTDSVTTYQDELTIVKVLDGVSGAGLFTMATTGASWDGTTLTKTAATSAWDAQGYSLESYLSAAYVTFQAGQTDRGIYAGLNQDPTSSANQSSIDYAWNCQGDGTARVVESGTVRTSTFAYTIASVFSIISDGVEVKYFIDSDLKYTSTLDPSGQKLHLDTSIFAQNASITNLRFGLTGGAGASAKGLKLQATSQVFQIPKAGGAITPSSITLSAVGQNLSGSPSFSVIAGTATLTGSGSSRTLTSANLATDFATIQVSQDGLTDTVTVVKVREGEDTILGFLTNEAHVVPADAAGVVSSFTGSGGTFKMFRGLTDVTTGAGVAYSVLSETGVDVSINATSGVYTVSSMSADVGTATLRATLGSITVDKVYTISKSKAGAQGAAGTAGLNVAQVTLFRRSAAAPTKPSTSSTYTFATGVLTGQNNSWTQVPPAGSDPLWVTVATASASGATDSIAGSEWATPVLFVENGAPGADGAAGAPGLNTATVYLFRRNDTGTAPAVPSSTLTYTFATGLLTGTLSGWSQTVPPSSSGKYLFVTTATALGSGATDTIGTGEWATVQIMAEIGSNAKAAFITATSQVFQVSKAGSASPSSITLTALGQNLSGSPSFSVTSGTATLTGSGNTRTLTYADLTTDTATIRVTWDGITDDITIAKVREGLDSVLGFLTNEAHVVPTDAAGNGGSFTAAGGTFKVFQGQTDVTSSGNTFSVAASSGVSISINSTSGVYTVSGMSADLGTATLRCVRGGVTIDKTYTISKSRAGTNGADGANGTDGVEGQGIITWNLSAGMSYSNGVLRKASGTAGWNAHAYSTEVYTNSAFLSFQAGQTNLSSMIGFNTDPTTDASYTSIDYAWYMQSDATADIYEDGSYKFTVGARSVDDVFSMVADAKNVRYFHNGVLVYTSAKSPAGQKLYLDSSFNSINASLRNIRFGASGSVGEDAISATLSLASFNLPAFADGVVQSYTGAVTSLDILRGTTNDNANWTFSRTNGTGVSSSISGNTVTITSLADGTDSSYVDITATRSGFPTQTKRFSLGKNKSAEPSSGPVGSQNFYAYKTNFFTVGTYTVTARVEFRADGSVYRYVFGTNGGGTSTKIGDWYKPTTSNIGAGYSIVFGNFVRSGTVLGATTKSEGVLSSTRNAQLSYTGSAATWAGGADVSYFITRNSDGAVVGGGSISLNISYEQ